MKRLLLDVDGVIADFYGQTRRDLVRAGGPELAPDPASWHFLDSIGAKWRDVIWDIWHAEGWVGRIPTYDGSVEAVNSARRLGYDVHFVTSVGFVTHRTWHRERVEWLTNWFRADPADVTFTSKKEFVRGDIFVDDKAGVPQEWARMNPDGIGVIWDHPYNRIGSDGPCLRMSSFYDLLEMLR